MAPYRPAKCRTEYVILYQPLLVYAAARNGFGSKCAARTLGRPSNAAVTTHVSRPEGIIEVPGHRQMALLQEWVSLAAILLSQPFSTLNLSDFVLMLILYANPGFVMGFTNVPAELASDEAYLNETRGPVVIGVTTMLIVLTSAAVSARVVARRMTRAKIAADDFLVFAAQVSMLSLLGSLMVLITTRCSQFIFFGLATEFFFRRAVTALIWTLIEPATAIICACLPVLRPLFLRETGPKSPRAKTSYRPFGPGSKSSSERSNASKWNYHSWTSTKRDDGQPFNSDRTKQQQQHWKNQARMDHERVSSISMESMQPEQHQGISNQEV
ncbi:MAG: hypothetical protein Q9187_004352 [Circinaria calcarea]